MRFLATEGNPAAKVKRAQEAGIRTASQVYVDAVQRFFPEIEIDVLRAADGEEQVNGRSFADYAGLIVGGSGLHAYDTTPEVLRQIEVMRRFAETGKPILGSCWGLQLAVIAAGGKVVRNEVGRELGIARKLELNDAGRAHPFFAGKRSVFDSPCIHYDEVAELPQGATLLCSNSHSLVQGAIVPLGDSEVWGVQYHPEFDLTQLRMLFELYGQDLVTQGFVEDAEDYDRWMTRFRRLEENPDNSALGWQMGIDEDVTDHRYRSLEIINWVNHCQGLQ